MPIHYFKNLQSFWIMSRFLKKIFFFDSFDILFWFVYLPGCSSHSTLTQSSFKVQSVILEFFIFYSSWKKKVSFMVVSIIACNSKEYGSWTQDFLDYHISSYKMCDFWWKNIMSLHFSFFIFKICIIIIPYP